MAKRTRSAAAKKPRGWKLLPASGWLVAAGIAVAWIGPGSLSQGVTQSVGLMPRNWQASLPASWRPAPRRPARTFTTPEVARTDRTDAIRPERTGPVTSHPAKTVASFSPAPTSNAKDDAPHLARIDPRPSRAKENEARRRNVPLPAQRPIFRRASGGEALAVHAARPVAVAASGPTPPDMVPLGVRTVTPIGGPSIPAGLVGGLIAPSQPPAPIIGASRQGRN
ncbi:hypothetical protein SAMN05428963_106241 [Consotaella salsifontis]|uniref:Uncharacterized protein n=1 Tax=Consotaella salsifontis TaxID=1365950 RepID=A0A1T4RE84_9HYPH|nr:hypothetical protein SAMN05428963_106241 [Consotaella salsifontis]